MRWNAGDVASGDGNALRRMDDVCREARYIGMRGLSLDEIELIARFGQGEMREEAQIVLNARTHRRSRKVA